jgi:cell wall-associated NlpC family hydrolase
MICSININVADVREKPSNRSERISQGLFNENVLIIEKGEAFSRVRFPDGYSGWIGNQFLSQSSDSQKDEQFFVLALFTTGHERPDVVSRKKTILPFACRLSGEVDSGFLKVLSKRYGEIFVPEGDLAEKSSLATPADVESEDIMIEAEKFLGVPYLWGGRTSFGVDCSGYVKAIFARFGIELPRDTKEQIGAGKEIPRAEIKRGDLLFFPRHVALAVSKNLIIHSSRKNGGVAYNSFDHASDIYNADLDKSFITAQRIFE